jgi:hypothetical protein
LKAQDYSPRVQACQTSGDSNSGDVAEGLDRDVVLLTAAPNSYSAHNW